MLGNVGVTFVVLLAVFIIGWEAGKSFAAKKFNKMIGDFADQIKRRAEDAKAEMEQQQTRREELFRILDNAFMKTKGGDTDGDRTEQNSEDS